MIRPSPSQPTVYCFPHLPNGELRWIFKPLDDDARSLLVFVGATELFANDALWSDEEVDVPAVTAVEIARQLRAINVIVTTHGDPPGPLGHVGSP